MPILTIEGNTIFPADLLSDVSHLSAQDEKLARSWCVVYTRARQEKAVARELFRYGVPFYLPLITSDRVISSRRIRSFLPLFTGCIFVYATDDERIRTLKTNRISRIVLVADSDRLRRDLNNVNRLIAADVPLSVERRLQAGRKVRIKTGPFRDFEGSIIRRQGRHRLVVGVDTVEDRISTEIDNVNFPEDAHRRAFNLYIDPGEAPQELLSDFYVALSAYYRSLGGSGLSLAQLPQ